MQIPQFTEQHAKLLSEFLTTQPGAMSLIQSQGYLFGTICSPEPLEVHQWLEQILPNTANDLDEDMLFLFMALHHQVSEQVFELGYKLPVEFDLEFCQQWSAGFLTASQTYTHKLLQSEQLDIQYKQALESAQATLSFFALDKPKIAQIAQQNNIDELHLCAQQYELMGDFALGFAELIEIVALNSGLYTDEGWDE
ncbi:MULTISPECIES: UPF0149 family protein [Pseudoalteromonas]|uniref:UPF0149 family protein n=1 Tax=Pseudoalteromonas TaxID=53246 RepID=UPI0002F46D1C|nr:MULTISPECIES: UPF0149 family protein [Pseudoalteromonas]MAY59107.1 YecA family protein [Pseudoalteromonas sp.]MDN3407152.1 UPF0149 family protein [Pseudoalteromonas sp. APC 3218]MDN3410786.1 UPF0149 family protein [Pseudoalteromonas sp. APC 3894]MDN3418100.1 UPF0149 family protein [Pseudoalteromonas sp. APC 3227]MDN3421808.1 UPF0149 family protein [Pseudoalteromonas sp. APC 3895]|tara:strand:- start:860 stop:1447 length:588 start_codon:yes stop_codon:yes gene_type:complete